MNVLHISTRDSEGAGGAAYKVHRGVIDTGASSIMLVMNKRINDDSIHEVLISKPRKYINRIIEKIQNWLSLFDPDYYFFNRGRYAVCSAKELKSYIQEKPDVIFVYWISKFVSLDTILELQQLYDAKVYWWVFDKEPMTGGCHYVQDCIGYLDQCKKCPAVKFIFKSLPHKNFIRKEFALSKLNLGLVYTTPWMKELLSSAPLLDGKELFYVPSMFDEDTFDIKDVDHVISKFNLRHYKLRVMFGSVRTNEKRKGFEYFIKSLIQYQSEYASDNIIILTIGSHPLELNKYGIKLPYIHLGSKHDPGERAMAYNSADVFISPSTEDMGPAMLVESMLCGVPVIAFDVGVAKDLIVHDENGFIVSNYDYQSIATCIHKMYSMNSGQRKLMRDRSRQQVLKVFPKVQYKLSLSKLLD